MYSPTYSERIKKFWTKIKQGSAEDCWMWHGGIMNTGYGRFCINYRDYLAHRLVYSLVRGPIPDGMVVDHLCRRRLCCNPWHMEIVTSGENVLRGESLAAKNARKTTCKHGHPFTPSNTTLRTYKGRAGRICKECQRVAGQRARDKKKARLVLDDPAIKELMPVRRATKARTESTL